MITTNPFASDQIRCLDQGKMNSTLRKNRDCICVSVMIASISIIFEKPNQERTLDQIWLNILWTLDH